MGIAEIIPGVSGGTIAFITGIYERLINSIKSFHPNLFPLLKREGIKAVWNKIDGSFLVALFAGMLFSIVLFVNLITWLIEAHPLLLWSFFFGLILGSCIYIGRKVKTWNLVAILLSLAAVFVAYYITIAVPAQGSEAPWFIFFCGAIAVSALLLPGLSGSFILLLLGMYQLIMGSVRDLDLKIITLFGSGMLLGVLTFSHVLSWAFRKYKNATLAILTGFMLGSLNKIWPWREVLSYRTNSSGEREPFLEKSVLPNDYSGDPMIISCLLLMILGFVAVFLLERLDQKQNEPSL